eukprot:TRINITY_DN12630_c0_g1_i3.p1 TRINITY_DN12630_c0_g1~~TRINITY_DN12630_c0_g1_i3.p1  ORF type:complete len:109 (-),score=10.77 TRINITY_DN12630_c0_g1_i3:250-576(-)
MSSQPLFSATSPKSMYVSECASSFASDLASTVVNGALADSASSSGQHLPHTTPQRVCWDPLVHSFRPGIDDDVAREVEAAFEEIRIAYQKQKEKSRLTLASPKSLGQR